MSAYTLPSDQELQEMAREFGPQWVQQHPDQPANWTNGHWSDEAMVFFAFAFARYTLERAVEYVRELKAQHDSLAAIHGRFMKRVKQAGVRVELFDLSSNNLLVNERAESARSEERERLAALIKAIYDARIPCRNHKPLRHPMCAGCQLDARIEEAAAAIEETK